MKVYELMNALSKYEAGLEVKINGCMTVPELRNCAELDEDENGNILYSVTGKCNDVDGDTKGVVLYF